MSEVKRYELGIQPGYYDRPYMEEDETGDYVLHSDYAAVVAERDALALVLAKSGYEYTSYTDNYHCVVCKCRKGDGHTPGCPVALAEKVVKEVGGV